MCSPCTSPPCQFGVYWVTKTLQQRLHTSLSHGPVTPVCLESFPRPLLSSHLGPERYISETTTCLNAKQATFASCAYGQARNSALVLLPYPLASPPYLGPLGVRSLARFVFVVGFLRPCVFKPSSSHDTQSLRATIETSVFSAVYSFHFGSTWKH